MLKGICMPKSKTKLLICILIILIPIALYVPVEVKAIGQSAGEIYIQFKGMDDELCYGTLLSVVDYESACFGSYDGPKYNLDEKEIWQAFMDYQDPDGYYFVEFYAQCNETKRLDWTYDAPLKFKILLYYPESNRFLSSGIYEQNSYENHYIVDLTDMGQNIENYVLKAEELHEYGSEIVDLLIKIVLFLIIGFGIAFMFAFSGRKTICFIMLENVLIKLITYVILGCFAHFHGIQIGYLLVYGAITLILTVAEPILFCICLPRISEGKTKKWKCILYPILKNIILFVIEMRMIFLI